MHQLTILVSKLKIRKDTLGQDLIEYALLGGLLAVGAGVVLPSVSNNVYLLFSHVTSVLTAAIGTTNGPGNF